MQRTNLHRSLMSSCLMRKIVKYTIIIPIDSVLMLLRILLHDLLKYTQVCSKWQLIGYTNGQYSQFCLIANCSSSAKADKLNKPGQSIDKFLGK